VSIYSAGKDQHQIPPVMWPLWLWWPDTVSNFAVMSYFQQLS
jgi:hypothetical protein